MKVKQTVLMLAVIVTVVAVSHLLMTALASAQPAPVVPPVDAKEGETKIDRVFAVDPFATNAVSVTFPPGPWPWYAQGEITVHPEPPIPGQPTEICASVVNNDPTAPHTVTLEFGIANFGIGVPFTTEGVVEIQVPPDGDAEGCIVWVPPQEGHWCIEVLLWQPGAQEPERSQRNIDVWEPLEPGVPHEMVFPVGPLPDPGWVSFTIDSVQPGWDVSLNPREFTLDNGAVQMVTLTTSPPAGAVLGTQAPLADVEGFLDGNTIGGFRKMDTPPVPLHRRPEEPSYAESEITVWPYPPRPGEPTQICAELFNLSDEPQTVAVEFAVANFGIGLPFMPIDGVEVNIPPGSFHNVCTWWIPPNEGHFCVQVKLDTLGPIPYETQFSQRNLDVTEPLEPGVAHTLEFPVGNPSNQPATITLGLVPHIPDWGLDLSADTLPDMGPDEHRTISLTVVPPPGQPLPHDGQPIVDVEAYIGEDLIGGIRKIYRPPVPLHRFPDPPYAEREISVHPYPPMAGEPTEVCVELYNPTDLPQTVDVQFSWAHFGIGIPFTPINGLRTITIPPHSTVVECIHWIPPVSGHVCLQIELFMDGHRPQHSQRNIDIDEPLVPGQPHTLRFPVGNPFQHPVSVTLGLIPHLPNWEIWLSEDTLPDMAPNEHRIISLTVQPPPDLPLPQDATPIVDVEAYARDVLIGGFRKIHRPSIPLHPFPDPPYAEREIKIHPYPPLAGEPTEVCVELRNPTPYPQTVWVQFSWANFGIGIPFTPIDGLREVHLPPYSIVNECIHWVPPINGHMCLQVELFMDGYEPQRSQRNIDVDEPLEPGVPHERWVPIGNPFQEPMTITLGLIHHLPDWEITIDPDILPNMPPGHIEQVLLTVMPPPGVPLPPEGETIVDVEAYAEGELIGGFRKIFQPPIKLHPFPDPPYAEREITVHPYPPLAGEPTQVCVELRNPTSDPHTVWVQFSWANFGIGIPFTPINGLREVHLPPYSIANECMHWVPVTSGHVCLEVEMFMEGYEPQRSQRNIDVDEPLEPGVPHERWIPIGNPFNHPATITLGIIHHLPDWDITLNPDVLPDMPPGHVENVLLTVRPPADVPLPPDGEAIVDVEAYAEGKLIGGFRKVFQPPIKLHPFPDPPYAEREIGIHPYPPLAGEPTQVCVELRNPTPYPQTVHVQFSWAHFGIGLPFTPINGLRPVHLPPFSIVNECVNWVPPVSGHVCLQVEMFMDGYDTQRSQRNIDVDEPLEPGVTHERWVPIGNPFQEPMTVTLGLIPHLPDWNIRLEPDILPNMPPGHVEEVLLSVTPPANEPLPPDGHPIVDVEAFADGRLIGGFRKVFRPPVPIHRPQDPVYAEREIHVHPYPPRAFEPIELSAEIRNPTDEWQTIEVVFSVAPFGIGLPFKPAHDEPIVLRVPPHGMVIPGIMWIPPREGLWCIQVEIFIAGHEKPFWSRLNLDVGEPLEPNVPHSRPFPVSNPFTEPITITLGLIPHFPDWGLDLSEDVLPDVAPGEMRVVTLTVTPPNDLPEDGDPIVDVEAFVDGELLGGFRKIFRPPVPIHRPKDPVYAESEIGIAPYPVIPGQPVELSVEVFNPTDNDHYVTATFSIAPFGIGLPFSVAGIGPDNPILVFVPAHGAARGHVVWEPPEGFFGKFCVMVELEMPGHEMVWSQRNVDVGEPLEPGQPHSMTFPVGRGTFTQPVTVTLGLVNHRDDFETDMSSDSFFDVFYEIEVNSDDPVTVTLIVTPSENAPLGTGEPIVDVEAFVDGELLGGFRKLDIPPIPLHRPHEKEYAETELSIIPDPPRLGQPAQIGAEMQNNGAVTSTITLEFGYARFGVGIPFTTTGMVPYTRSMELGPMMTDTAWVTWTPTFAGSHCVMVKLIDPDGDYEDLVSQRNVWVEERPPCGQERVFTFTLYNDSPFSVTIDLGLITFNVPEDWEVSTNPEGSVEVGPFDELEVEVHVRIPCPGSLQLMYDARKMYDVQAQAGSVPTIDVEGYIDGELIGGIEIQFSGDAPISVPNVYLPVVLRNS